MKLYVPGDIYDKMRDKVVRTEGEFYLNLSQGLERLASEFNGRWCDDDHFEIEFENERDATLFLLRWS